MKLLRPFRGYLSAYFELRLLKGFAKLRGVLVRLVECASDLIDVERRGAQQLIRMLLALREDAPFRDQIVHMAIQHLMRDRLIGCRQSIQHRIESVLDILRRRGPAEPMSQHAADHEQV